MNFAVVSVLALFLAGGQLIFGGLLLLYRGRYVSGSFDELRALAVSVYGRSRHSPRSVSWR